MEFVGTAEPITYIEFPQLLNPMALCPTNSTRLILVRMMVGDSNYDAVGLTDDLFGSFFDELEINVAISSIFVLSLFGRCCHFAVGMKYHIYHLTSVVESFDCYAQQIICRYYR